MALQQIFEDNVTSDKAFGLWLMIKDALNDGVALQELDSDRDAWAYAGMKLDIDALGRHMANIFLVDNMKNPTEAHLILRKNSAEAIGLMLTRDFMVPTLEEDFEERYAHKGMNRVIEAEQIPEPAEIPTESIDEGLDMLKESGLLGKRGVA